MYYRVKLLNNSVDNSTADIILHESGDNVVLYVSSDNRKMKNHLDNIISREAYILGPGTNTSNTFSDAAVHVYPNTLYYFQALPEILSWYGYYASYHREVHKSASFMEQDWYVIKSTGDSIYYNNDNERIVRYVPQGYIAVHSDGRAVAGGRYLNANIDKEDAQWSLVENPYEGVADEEREAAQQYMDMQVQDYHPGVHSELYQKRESEDDDFFQLDREFSAEGKKLSEHFEKPQEPELPKELSPGKILYSPDTGYALRSEDWPPNISNYTDHKWFVFEDNGLSDEEKKMYASLTGNHPMLITGLDGGPIKAEAGLNTDDGFLFSAPETAKSEIELNLRDREPYSLSEMATTEYRNAVEKTTKELKRIKRMTQERNPETGELQISKNLENIDIPELNGEHANVRLSPYAYQKAGILALTEESQYEKFGGPKGWHGHFLHWAYGLGKVQPNDEVVYTPQGKKTMGEINEGDYVLSEKGEPVKVVKVFPHKDWEFYTVTFSDGSTVECGKEHLWFTKTYVDRMNERQSRRGYRQTSKENPKGPYKRKDRKYGSVKSTEDIMNSLYHRNTQQGDKVNHSIPMAEPVHFEDTTLPLDPYLVGVFLGDGSMDSMMVSSKDEEIINQLDGLSLLRVVEEKDYYFSRKGISSKFGELGLLGKTSENKFIPESYLYTSVEKRIRLLQGLMDTDGYAMKLSPSNIERGRSKNSGAEYTTVSKQLASDVRELVLSLGGKAVIGKGVGSYVNSDGERIMCKDKYRVHISFPEDIGFNPFSLSRKAEVFGYHKKENWNKFIVDVQPSRVSDGACILIDSESHLYLTRDYTVTHNTAVVAGANAVMRNKGQIENGTQTTLVTAPNKNLYVWQSEIGKFLGEHAEVIDGDRASRIEQWETLLQKARDGELPSFVIVGSSKFSYMKEGEPDEDEKWELALDAKYMKLLALGGKSGETYVGGGHIGAFAIDESGQYVNPDSARHHALNEIVEGVYQGGGITWTLNGDISGNSATDTISESSFINAFARDNYTNLAQEYTKTNRDVKRESKKMNRRIWKDHNRLRDFMANYGQQIYPLDGRTIAGENFGFKRTEDMSAPLGKVWGKVYEKAISKLLASMELKQMNRALGLMSIMISASYGAVNPARLLEYDLGTKDIMEAAQERLIPSEFQEFKEQVEAFHREATENKYSMSLGRLPIKDMDIAERNKIYESTISEENRVMLESIASSWEAPVITQVMDQIEDEIYSNQIAGKNLRMGVAGFSKIAINNLYQRLREKYSDDKFLIQIVDGDTPSTEVKEIQTRHQNESDKTVITLVTGAGLYGLSLPADRSWRFPTWNSAKAGQYEGRFHRKAEQKNTTTVMVPDGIASYMRDIEGEKSRMAREATGALIEADDSSDELDIKEVTNMASFLNQLNNYRPRILEE